jgi:8-oxo-dGTP pyrophosphatase MutT (NUDIX family)
MIRGRAIPAQTGSYRGTGKMNMNATPPSPSTGQSAAARQVAALCWRQQHGDIEVLLITSRETGRWVIPKGWPIGGLTAAEAAAREAWEEAGVRGQVQTQPLGEFLYDKVTGPAKAKRCNVVVFALEVGELKDRFPEATQRKRSWFVPSEAAGLVAEPDLRALLTTIAERPECLNGQNPAPLA